MTGRFYKYEMIRTLRKLGGITQRELGRKVGVSRMIVYKAEVGKAVTMDCLERIAGVFGLPLKDFLRDQPSENFLPKDAKSVAQNA